MLQGVGDIAQEANIGNRISRAEKNASCFDRVADVLDLREASVQLPDRIASVFLLLALFGKQIDYLLSV